MIRQDDKDNKDNKKGRQKGKGEATGMTRTMTLTQVAVATCCGVSGVSHGDGDGPLTATPSKGSVTMDKEIISGRNLTDKQQTPAHQ